MTEWMTMLNPSEVKMDGSESIVSDMKLKIAKQLPCTIRVYSRMNNNRVNGVVGEYWITHLLIRMCCVDFTVVHTACAALKKQ